MTTPKVTPLVKVNSGYIKATHHHPMYGACVIKQRYDHGWQQLRGHAVIIVTSGGTALVKENSLKEIA